MARATPPPDDRARRGLGDRHDAQAVTIQVVWPPVSPTNSPSSSILFRMCSRPATGFAWPCPARQMIRRWISLIMVRRSIPTIRRLPCLKMRHMPHSRAACYRERSPIAWYPLNICGVSLRYAALGVASLAPLPALAAEIDTGNPELTLRWDNTVKYSVAFRVRKQSPSLIDNAPITVNQDDGDRNFGRGIISNRWDLFSEADVVYRNFGARLSGAAWYDTVYNRTNDNNSPTTANQVSVPYNQFTHATRDVQGGNAELLDGFVFGSGNLGETTWSLRAGKHSIIWGESLFFGSNGIAGAQAPVDAVKLSSVPNSLFKETIRPIGQISGQLQITPDVSLAGYYQYQWKKSRLSSVGSYFSNTDVVDAGGERVIVGNPIVAGGGPAAFFRSVDESAKNTGQLGLALRLHAAGVDYGIYALQWHSKSPVVYLKPSSITPADGPAVVTNPSSFDPARGEIGQYYLVYPENIRSYGVSASTGVGEATVSAELSIRRNTPLVSNAQTVLAGLSADNDKNPLYAIGNSLHAQASFAWSMPPNVIARSASFLGEVAFNRRTTIKKNQQALDPNSTIDAVALRLVYEPAYRQVAPGLDMTVPVGLGYSPRGRSSVVSSFAVDKGGDITIGLTANYLETWRASLLYTHYYGRVAPATDAERHYSYAQSLGDRDFISFSLRTTF
jgi:hypothetical protein